MKEATSRGVPGGGDGLAGIVLIVSLAAYYIVRALFGNLIKQLITRGVVRHVYTVSPR